MTAPEPSKPGPAEGRVGIVAGGGALPIAIVSTLSRRGENPFVVLIEGEADAAPNLLGAEHVRLRVEDLGLMLPAVRQAGVRRLIFAGHIGRRPRLHRIRWTWPLLKAIPRLTTALAAGDDKLLRTLVAIAEENGIKIAGAQDVVPDLLAPLGVLTRAQPLPPDERDVEAASEAALALGMLDIGQGAISIGGRVVALEGIEGTDGLLERMIGLRNHGRLAGRKRGVLVKRCKPQQDLRVDLPAIGPDTIASAHACGLAGVAVEAGRSFILDFDRTIALADERGLFVLGLSPAGEVA